MPTALRGPAGRSKATADLPDSATCPRKAVGMAPKTNRRPHAERDLHPGARSGISGFSSGISGRTAGKSLSARARPRALTCSIARSVPPDAIPRVAVGPGGVAARFRRSPF